jgi:hypothetical protein
MWSFIAGFLIVPIFCGLVGLLAFLGVNGYVPKPNFPFFFAGEITALAIVIVTVLIATSGITK